MVKPEWEMVQNDWVEIPPKRSLQIHNGLLKRLKDKGIDSPLATMNRLITEDLSEVSPFYNGDAIEVMGDDFGYTIEFLNDAILVYNDADVSQQLDDVSWLEQDGYAPGISE